MAEDGEKLSVTEVLHMPNIDALAEKAITDWAIRRAAAIRAAALVSNNRLGPKDHKRI